jgi:hypothetical protein
MLQLISIGLTALGSCHGNAAEPYSGDCYREGLESFQALESISNALPPVLGLAQLGDVAEFCQINGLRDFKETERDHNGLVESPWQLGFVASQDKREELFNSRIQEKEIDLVKTATPMTAADVQACNADIEMLKHSEVQQGEFKPTLLSTTFFCGNLTFAHLDNCSKSLSELYQIAEPHNDITLIDTWKKVLGDPIYLNVIKQVALKNVRMIRNGQTPQSRLFDDLNAAFRAELHDPRKAIENTFNLLGILASNGNDSFNYTPCRRQVSKNFSAAIEMLSLSSVVLDRRTAKKGFLYTYPKEVNSVCDYGKNYHFWMTAFLARQAALRTSDATGSAAAAFTIDEAYQFAKAGGGGRDPTKPFKENSFSNYNNNIRLDMAQAAAGAWFGATSISSSSKHLSREQFETGLKKIFEGSKAAAIDLNFKFPSSNEPLSLVKTFFKWKKIINPDAAFEYYESQMSRK